MHSLFIYPLVFPYIEPLSSMLSPVFLFFALLCTNIHPYIQPPTAQIGATYISIILIYRSVSLIDIQHVMS
jgi:hypothetical protein